MSDNVQNPPLMLPFLAKPKQKRALIKKAGRISRILELRVKGYTHEQIAKELKCNEKTIRRNLKDEPTQSFIDTLMQAQLADIIEAKTGTRLHYRDKLLEKLMPRKIEQKTEGKLQVESLQIGFEADPEIKELLNKEATKQKTEHDTQQKPTTAIVAIHSTP